MKPSLRILLLSLPGLLPAQEWTAYGADPGGLRYGGIPEAGIPSRITPRNLSSDRERTRRLFARFGTRSVPCPSPWHTEQRSVNRSLPSCASATAVLDRK